MNSTLELFAVFAFRGGGGRGGGRDFGGRDGGGRIRDRGRSSSRGRYRSLGHGRCRGHACSHPWTGPGGRRSNCGGLSFEPGGFCEGFLIMKLEEL